MGFRLVRITTDMLAELLRYDGIGRQETMTLRGLPKDAEIIDIDTNDLCISGRVTIKFQSRDWEQNTPGELIEVHPISVRTLRFAMPEVEPSPFIAGISR